jgi:hypothetical protein
MASNRSSLRCLPPRASRPARQSSIAASRWPLRSRARPRTSRALTKPGSVVMRAIEQLDRGLVLAHGQPDQALEVETVDVVGA